MPTRVREVTTDEGWDEAVPILRQLWSHVDDAFVRGWREEDDYRLFGLYETDGGDAADGTGAGPDGTLVAVAGVSVQRVLHHERHLWVHDFVVDEPRRGEGFGSELLDWLDGWARDRGCENLALACWAENDEGRAFYESEGLDVWGQVLEREL
ncbi:GNAT family N-acetyltransferase [Halosimplex halophilum]|uniref:GNAT family N-acetyltransferase n=1 Tax=Halosimplex halophilum TaxID=2559572 RepID=UPI00107F29A6|nr:GNAT family N-acetyltransferase [Halosimplex halophilum]